MHHGAADGGPQPAHQLGLMRFITKWMVLRAAAQLGNGAPVSWKGGEERW